MVPRMTAFPEDRMLSHIVDALQRLGGMASLEEIEGQVARSGAFRLPPDALDAVVQLTLRANRDGRGMGCFSQLDSRSFGLSPRFRPPGGPKAIGSIPATPARPEPPA